LIDALSLIVPELYDAACLADGQMLEVPAAAYCRNARTFELLADLGNQEHSSGPTSSLDVSVVLIYSSNVDGFSPLSETELHQSSGTTDL
jgi:hypothetical protein